MFSSEITQHAQRLFTPLTTFAFAIALQLQITIFANDAYTGLRVNSADFLLPLVGLCILISLIAQRSKWPEWTPPFGYWSLALLTLVFSYSLLNSYLLYGDVSQWALVNKFAGWFVLCAYIGLAAWLATNNPRSFFGDFNIGFLFTFCAVALFGIAQYFVFWELDSTLLGSAPLSLEGFMYNRNAYAFLTITVLISCIFSPYGLRYKKLEKMLHIAFWVLLPLIIYFNSSRALWLCAVLLMPLLLTQYKILKLRHVAVLIGIGIITAGICFPATQARGLKPLTQTIMLFVNEEDKSTVAQAIDADDSYNDVRFNMLDDSFGLLEQHPIRGAGLGAILEEQKTKDVKILSVLDNTLLWILTEMGPLGLLSFVLVYFVMLKSMIGKKGEPIQNPEKMTIALMVFFGVFSLFHEIMYTRFFWFLCGLSLVKSLAPDKKATETPLH